jgi:type VI secretion system secreted protein Hcp
MALNAYLTMKGQKQGDIRGSVTQKGREGSIQVHSFSNEIFSPRDAASGLPTGKRMHKPFVILKEVDKSSPLLWNALVENENLAEWTLDFWEVSTAAPEKQIYSIRLTNASIASMRESMLDNEDAANAKYTLLEEISFTYQRIEWVWTEGKITAQDNWESSY